MRWQRREWLAAVAVLLLTLIVWGFIEWRMQPPPVPAVSGQDKSARP
jgi:hypothetical protein